MSSHRLRLSRQAEKDFDHILLYTGQKWGLKQLDAYFEKINKALLEVERNTNKLLDPISPGEILLEEFMKPVGISINALSRAANVPLNRISGIVNGKRSITADTALRLGKYFAVSPEIWLNLQSDYAIRIARRTV